MAGAANTLAPPLFNAPLDILYVILETTTNKWDLNPSPLPGGWDSWTVGSP